LSSTSPTKNRLILGDPEGVVVPAQLTTPVV